MLHLELCKVRVCPLSDELSIISSFSESLFTPLYLYSSSRFSGPVESVLILQFVLPYIYYYPISHISFRSVVKPHLIHKDYSCVKHSSNQDFTMDRDDIDPLSTPPSGSNARSLRSQRSSMRSSLDRPRVSQVDPTTTDTPNIENQRTSISGSSARSVRFGSMGSVHSDDGKPEIPFRIALPPARDLGTVVELETPAEEKNEPDFGKDVSMPVNRKVLAFLTFHLRKKEKAELHGQLTHSIRTPKNHKTI